MLADDPPTTRTEQTRLCGERTQRRSHAFAGTLGRRGDARTCAVRTSTLCAPPAEREAAASFPTRSSGGRGPGSPGEIHRYTASETLRQHWSGWRIWDSPFTLNSRTGHTERLYGITVDSGRHSTARSV